jgi:hypothetical protein
MSTPTVSAGPGALPPGTPAAASPGGRPPGTPAVPAPPRPRRRWIWITVALVTAFVIVTPVSLRLWLKASHRNLSLPTQVYRQPLTQLRVVAPAGSITVVPSRRREVTVTGSLSWDFARPNVTQAVHGQTLLIDGGCPAPDLFEDCQVSLTIQVPARLAVSVVAGSGSISVSGLTGPLHLAVSSGSITMARVSGPVRASSGSGSITGSGVTAAAVQAVIGSGSLQLGLAAVPQDLNVAIGSGSAGVTVPRGARMKVLADAGSGTLQVTPGITDMAAAGTLTATIGTGTLTVGYPPGR